MTDSFIYTHLKRNYKGDVLNAYDLGSGDLEVKGNLTVQGTTTTLNTNNLNIEDNLIALNNGDTGDTLNQGVLLLKNSGAQYNGLMKKAGTTNYYLLGNNNISTVNDNPDSLLLGRLSVGQVLCKNTSLAFNDTTNQGLGAIAIGGLAGSLNQGISSISVGESAGQNNQGQECVSIGYQAGYDNQGNYGIAIGKWAGNNQSTEGIAIGINAANNRQGTQSIAIGTTAGNSTMGTQAVAIGFQAGQHQQGNDSIAIGDSAARTFQSTNSIAMGTNAGAITQGTQCVAIGLNAGNSSQQIGSSALGSGCGQINQGNYSVAMGFQSGQTNQSGYSLGIGCFAGQGAQGTQSVAIGNQAGQTNQGGSSVAIGPYAGQQGQGASSVAVGQFAGIAGQGGNSVAIGAQAGQTNQHANTIILNASGAVLNSAQTSSIFVRPIRNASYNNILNYNLSTYEVCSDNGFVGAYTPTGLWSFSNTTDSTSSTSNSAIKTAGGISVAKSIYAGGSGFGIYLHSNGSANRQQLNYYGHESVVMDFKDDKSGSSPAGFNVIGATVHLTRIGRIINIQFSTMSRSPVGGDPTPTTAILSTTAIPLDYRPNTIHKCLMAGRNGSNRILCEVNSTGIISIYRDLNNETNNPMDLTATITIPVQTITYTAA